MNTELMMTYEQDMHLYYSHLMVIPLILYEAQGQECARKHNKRDGQAIWRWKTNELWMDLMCCCCATTTITKKSNSTNNNTRTDNYVWMIVSLWRSRRVAFGQTNNGDMSIYNSCAHCAPCSTSIANHLIVSEVEMVISFEGSEMKHVVKAILIIL